jgi:hypothetical protein
MAFPFIVLKTLKIVIFGHGTNGSRGAGRGSNYLHSVHIFFDLRYVLVKKKKTWSPKMTISILSKSFLFRNN